MSKFYVHGHDDRVQVIEAEYLSVNADEYAFYSNVAFLVAVVNKSAVFSVVEKDHFVVDFHSNDPIDDDEDPICDCEDCLAVANAEHLAQEGE